MLRVSVILSKASNKITLNSVWLSSTLQTVQRSRALVLLSPCRLLMLREGLAEKLSSSTVLLKNISVQRETPTC